MAKAGKSNPMMTKTGKPRLGPLNFKQLTDLLSKTQKKKEKAKIERRIAELASRPGFKAPEAVVEEV